MIELLKRLSEIAPDVCEQIEKDAIYARNIYFDGHKCVSAIEDDAWLQLALQTDCIYISPGSRKR